MIRNRTKKENKTCWIQKEDALYHYKNGRIHKDNGPAVIFPDKEVWYHYGKIHRDNDLPAVIYKDGSKEWYCKGKRHRLGGNPARIKIIKGGIIKEWWLEDEIHLQECSEKFLKGELIHYINHFLNGTKVSGSYGYSTELKESFVKLIFLGSGHTDLNHYHSYGDIPSVVRKSWFRKRETKEWHCAGKLHREYGPAVIYSNGDKEWWIHGERHRLDGPAVEYANGNKIWFEYGRFVRRKIKCT
ncbi:MAG: hypothetical protein EKK64_06780 [Neisseriaceae bacterium]|nr:MAG: hypothetical protein EKK64_06780 [Neisseriaceae bacterium]